MRFSLAFKTYDWIRVLTDSSGNYLHLVPSVDHLTLLLTAIKVDSTVLELAATSVRYLFVQCLTCSGLGASGEIGLILIALDGVVML